MRRVMRTHSDSRRELSVLRNGPIRSDESERHRDGRKEIERKRERKRERNREGNNDRVTRTTTRHYCLPRSVTSFARDTAWKDLRNTTARRSVKHDERRAHCLLSRLTRTVSRFAHGAFWERAHPYVTSRQRRESAARRATMRKRVKTA